jgi:NhaP-type Na+/H+ or K+/H+ antiporter
MELDILLTIIFTVILIGAARWMIGVLIQALINLIGALVSATGAIVLIGALVWLLNSMR